MTGIGALTGNVAVTSSLLQNRFANLLAFVPCLHLQEKSLVIWGAKDKITSLELALKLKL
jgi:hypothetical protein